MIGNNNNYSRFSVTDIELFLSDLPTDVQSALGAMAEIIQRDERTLSILKSYYTGAGFASSSFDYNSGKGFAFYLNNESKPTYDIRFDEYDIKHPSHFFDTFDYGERLMSILAITVGAHGYAGLWSMPTDVLLQLFIFEKEVAKHMGIALLDFSKFTVMNYNPTVEFADNSDTVYSVQLRGPDRKMYNVNLSLRDGGFDSRLVGAGAGLYARYMLQADEGKGTKIYEELCRRFRNKEIFSEGVFKHFYIMSRAELATIQS